MLPFTFNQPKLAQDWEAPHTERKARSCHIYLLGSRSRSIWSLALPFIYIRPRSRRRTDLSAQTYVSPNRVETTHTHECRADWRVSIDTSE